MIDKSRRPAAFVLKGNTMATLKQTQPALDPARMPRHIAIIMDGNGRWAQKRGLPRTAGHKVGAETFRRIATCCKNLGLDYLTVYAFSTENWKRSEDEISTIMRLFEAYLHEAIDDHGARPDPPENSRRAVAPSARSCGGSLQKPTKFPRATTAFRQTSASTTADVTKLSAPRGVLPRCAWRVRAARRS